MTKTEEKYLAFLKELHTILTYTDKVSTTKLARDHGVVNNTTKFLQDGKILSKDGNASGCKWKWVGRKPDVGMARGLIERVNTYMSAQRQDITEAEVLAKKETTKSHYSFSILWGLIKVVRQ